MLIPLSPQAKMKNESNRTRFFVHYGVPNLFEDTIGYKKRELLCNFFILVCSGCPWQRFGITKKSFSHSFHLARSVPSNPSLTSPLLIQRQQLHRPQVHKPKPVHLWYYENYPPKLQFLSHYIVGLIVANN